MPKPPVPPPPPFPPGSPGQYLVKAGWQCNRRFRSWNKPSLTGDAWVTTEEAMSLQKEQDNETPAVVDNLD